MQDEINTDFQWQIYANATLAGLSELIPIPLVDLAFSRWFERRVVTSIAKHRGYKLPPKSAAMINKGRGCGCFGLLLILPLELIKRMIRTVAYLLTVHAATKSVSENWQRAFLIDYSIQQGHLDDWQKAEIASTAIEKAINANKVDPFLHLAREVVSQSKHTLRSLFRVTRTEQEDDTVSAAKNRMRQGWDGVRGNLVDLAWQYDATWAHIAEITIDKQSTL